MDKQEYRVEERRGVGSRVLETFFKFRGGGGITDPRKRKRRKKGVIKK